jgi:hypothetical protein
MILDRLRGIIEYKSGLIRYFYPWGFAMNGMTSRLEAVRQIVFSLRIERIIETGTFRGATAEWFAQLGLPLETVELIQRYYSFSRERLRGYSNVGIFLNSSVAFLNERIANRGVEPDLRQLFYLDSHWEKALPLREEIELIFNNYSNAVVVIDDFQVPDDPGYGYDAYSEEDQITERYLSRARVPRSLRYYYPSTKAENETGAKRGWAVVVDSSQIGRELDGISLVRRLNR